MSPLTGRIIIASLLGCLLVGAWGCSSAGSARWERRTLATLQSHDPIAQREALLELEGPATPAVRQAAEAILRGSQDQFSRAMAADALARIGTPDSAEELRLSAGQDVSDEVRLRALRALVALQGEGAADVLESAVAGDPEPTVRVTAVELAARSLAPERAMPILLRALRDDSKAVRITAYQHLCALTGETLPLEDYEGWQKAASARAAGARQDAAPAPVQPEGPVESTPALEPEP